MKKFLAFVFAMAVSVVANAGLTISFSSADFSSPLEATLKNGSTVVKTFDTFCLQENVSFVQNANAAISDKIKAVGMAQAPATLENATKQLYAAYLNNSSAFDADQVQSDIWTMESLVYNPATGTLIDYASPTLFYISGSKGNWSYSYNVAATGWESVKVVNVFTADIKDGQDVLIRVPAPAAVLLAGLGTSLVGFVRRRTM